jgi:hypothetical protein
MSDTNDTIEVPAPPKIRERLRAVVAEARSLRKLLKLSEAAYEAQEASRSPATDTDGD